MRSVRNSGAFIYLCTFTLLAMPVHADQDEDDVLAVADLALELITAEDFVGLTDLMIDTAVAYTGTKRDDEYQVRTRSYKEQREAVINGDYVERGYDPTVLVSSPIAMVWYPYDFYLDGEWSHCGIDIFNLVRTNDGWRIASMMWNAEQPPACKPHPDGPPASSDD